MKNKEDIWWARPKKCETKVWEVTTSQDGFEEEVRRRERGDFHFAENLTNVLFPFLSKFFMSHVETVFSCYLHAISMSKNHLFKNLL